LPEWKLGIGVKSPIRADPNWRILPAESTTSIAVQDGNRVREAWSWDAAGALGSPGEAIPVARRARESLVGFTDPAAVVLLGELDRASGGSTA
jgi:hypothetical protein